jgi:surfactin synthase thioesterase subunit
MKSVTVFCLPFAGGSSYAYHEFLKTADPSLRLVSIDLPGHGKRLRESLLTDASKMIDDIYNQIAPQLSQGKYAIYGHSMGGLLGYLLIRKIEEKKSPMPVCLIVTGASGPSDETKERDRHLLDKDAFVKKLREYGGSTDEVLNDPQMMEFFEPILRADFKAVETYTHLPYETALNIPISVMIGDDEEITESEARLWQHETNQPLRFQMLKGKHFFIFHHVEKILEEMNDFIKAATTQSE